MGSHRPVHSGKFIAELRCKLVSQLLDYETFQPRPCQIRRVGLPLLTS